MDSVGTSHEPSELAVRLERFVSGLAEPAGGAGALIRAAAERTLDEVTDVDGPVVYDYSVLAEVVAFMESRELPDYGEPVEILDYQLWILSQVYARRWRSDGLPATKLLIIEAARGAAKTFLGSLMCTFEIARATEAIQVDMGSTDKGTSGRDVANLCRQFARQYGPPLKPLASNQFAAVTNTESSAAIEVLKPDPETYHGRRPRLVFLDEAAHYLKPVITRARTGAAKRKDGQVVTFSTPHHDRTVPYYGIRDQVVGELIEGVWKDHEVALCWCIDDDDPLEFSDSLVRKANPGLGQTIRIEEIRANYDSMVVHGGSGTRSDFCRQHYARFDDDISTLVGMDELRAGSGSCSFPLGQRMFMGLDLSRGAVHDSNRTDVCSVSFLMTDPEGVIHCRQRHFLPEHRLEHFGVRSKLPLLDWVADGWIQTCPGRTIDPDMIEAEIRDAAERFKVVEIGYDTWTFPREQLARWTSIERWPLEARARAEHVVPATEGFVDLVRRNRFRYNGDPVLERAIKNTRVRNVNGGRRPDKDPSRSMIDPFMSLVYGLSALFSHSGDVPSQYESGDVAC